MARKRFFWKKKGRIFLAVGVSTFFIFSKKVYLFIAEPLLYLKDCLGEEQKISSSFLLQWWNALSWKQKGGTINDASCLHRTNIAGIVSIEEEKNITEAVFIAQQHNKKISLAGERHSMGGQAFCEGCIVLDMRGYNDVLSINEDNKTITVQAGITWKKIQEVIDPYGFTVQAMQSINMFTIGGSISVNAHGIAHHPGSIGSTIISMTVILPSGEKRIISLADDPDLFRSFVGGYGLYGIISEVTIQLTDNKWYRKERMYGSIKDLPDIYRQYIKENEGLGMVYGRISLGGKGAFDERYLNMYYEHVYDKPFPPLPKDSLVRLYRGVVNLSKQGDRGKKLKWELEKNVEPLIQSCFYDHRSLMAQKEDCIVVRNYEMFDHMKYLKNRMNDTDILQEYFVPIDSVPAFLSGLQQQVHENNINLLNITMRFGDKDTISRLPYFIEDDMVAFVLYTNIDMSSSGDITNRLLDLETMTKNTIDLVLELQGTFYLPYMRHYSGDQLQKAYPGISSFFADKKLYDSQEIIQNTRYNAYKEIVSH